MAYMDIVEMAGNQSFIARVAACAAAEGISNPQAWAVENIWKVAGFPGFDGAWRAAEANKTINQNPDTGARTDVISDAMLQASVKQAKNKPA